MARQSRWVLGVTLAALGVADSRQNARAQDGDGVGRVTARTPDRMVSQALARAAGDRELALADVALVHALATDAAAGQARRGLEDLGRRRGEVFEQARWVAAALEPDPERRPAGLLGNLAILGPFRDPGGGLTRREGPETAGQVWGDPRATYDWGVHQVRWRAVPEVGVTARGVPLDLMIHPRKESCSYLATRVRLPAPQSLVVLVAASGSVRMMWDGVDAGRSEELHAGLLFDRIGARIEAAGGDHLLAVKVCSGAIGDSGRVRIRAQAPDGRPLDLVTSTDLAVAPGRQQADRLSPSPTALGRVLALAMGEAGSDAGERTLALALVRRLGHADDLRSPRVPGLLDSVATAAAVTPDRLAAAGWVAPFGAQRSGWLGLALERARASGDRATASFCQRVLAETRARAGFADWALATTSAPPLATEEDPEARLVRATARASLGQESIRRQALGELLRIARDEGARASAALWSNIAWLARDLDAPTHLRATDEIATRLPERRDREWIEARIRVGQAAVLQASETALASGSALASTDALLAVGELLERAGLERRAHTVYRQGAELGPNRPAVFTALARTHYQQRDRAAGDRALHRARALDPSDPRTRAEESLRAQISRTGGSPKTDTVPGAEPPSPGVSAAPLPSLSPRSRGEGEQARVGVPQPPSPPIQPGAKLGATQTPPRSRGEGEQARVGVPQTPSPPIQPGAKPGATQTLPRSRGEGEQARVGVPQAPSPPIQPGAKPGATQTLPRSRGEGEQARVGVPQPPNPPIQPGATQALPRSRGEGGQARVGGTGPGGELGAVESLLASPAVFLARKAREAARPGEVWSRILHRLYAETLHPDRKASRLLHVADEVVVEPRTQAELLWSFSFEGTPQILRAVVHHADGTVEPALEQRVDRGRARIRWRALKAGDVAEYALHSWTDRPVGQRDDYPHYGFRTAGSTTTRPTLHSEVVLEFPENVRLAHDVLHGKPDRTLDETNQGRRTLRFIWDNPPNMADEPLAPDATEVLPTVVWSLYPSWGDFVRWHREATEGFTEPDEQIRRLARELTAGKTTRDEKLHALFGYVADRIRYVNYQSAERWLPNRPQQVLARRQGDCDDKSTLLVSLLAACGIEANLVLVQTRDTLRRPSLLSAGRAAIPALDHAIAFLPGVEGEPGVWLNPTAPQSRVGRLYSNEAGVPAILMTRDGAVKTTTPAPSPDDHGRDAHWQVTLTRSGAGELAADERHRGDDAFWLRSKLGEAETRAQIVEREVLAHWWPSVGVDRKVDFDAGFAFKPGDGGARLTYRARSDAFARRQGDALVFPLAPLTTLTSRLAPLTSRSLPVVLPVYSREAGAPSRDTRTIEVRAPAGYRLAGLPRSGSEPGGEFGEARLECTRKSDRLVVVQSTLSIRADLVMPEKYASWRSWLSRVDSLLHQSVRFVPIHAPRPRVAGK